MLISESYMTYNIYVKSMFYVTELLQVMEGGVHNVFKLENQQVIISHFGNCLHIPFWDL